jgi:hypothetical protein
MIGSDCEVAPDNLCAKYPNIHKKCLFLSGCKINQNMEFGDIIYLILILFFAILGFSNESRKKKNQQQQSEKDFGHTLDDEEDEPRLQHLPGDLPPVPAHQAQMSTRPEFRSSLDLVTDFEEASSLKGSIFVYDADESFTQESTQDGATTGQTSAFDQRSFVHPLLVELTGDGAVEALKKGLIYGEIMQRKY